MEMPSAETAGCFSGIGAFCVPVFVIRIRLRVPIQALLACPGNEACLNRIPSRYDIVLKHIRKNSKKLRSKYHNLFIYVHAVHTYREVLQ